VGDEHVTLRAQWLGQLIRELREERKLNLKEAAEYLERTSGTVSRFESGIYPVRRTTVEALLDLYKVSDEQRREVLLKLADEVWRTDWWDGYTGDVVGALIDYVWLESRASAVWKFDVMSVNGLLQTPDYARALIRGEDTSLDYAQVRRMAELRLMRQAVLDREEPLRMSVVIDEAALRRIVGGPEIYAAQLRHLAEQAKRPAIEVQVLPFAVGAHAGQTGPFSVFTLAGPYPEVAFVEGAAGGLYLEPPKTDRHIAKYDQLRETALDAEQSVKLIAAIADDLE